MIAYASPPGFLITKYQGRGLGKALIQFVEQQALKKEYDQIWLYANEVMQDNISFISA